VYCGRHDAHSEFVTDQQLERAKRAVGDWAVQSIGRMLGNSLGRLATPTPRCGFGIQDQLPVDAVLPAAPAWHRQGIGLVLGVGGDEALGGLGAGVPAAER